MSEEEKEAYNYLSQIMFDDETTEKYVNTLLGLIEKQQKEIEELKQITSLYNSYEVPAERKIVIADSEFFVKGFFKKNFIAKDKIREKIKELAEQMKAICKKEDCEDFECEEFYAIQILKDLLEEK